MATTPTAGSGDPSVLRQVERQNAALTARPQVSAAPAVTGTSSTPTSTASNNLRSLAPVVTGSEVLYPQSTTTTSSNAVTINSSVSNDAGDVTTVYSTNGQITVNPINQTINQYTAIDSGVSQIVAGNGVTITSTGGSGTGVVTINSVTTTLGNIVTINLDGNAANVLHGDGTWSADQTTYGNSNVAAYLPTYTGNIGGNVITANLFAGNGSSLSAITGANVSGFVPNANVANTAFAVAAANVTGLGNIATINLTGSTSNVLYGNGVFAPAAGGNVSELVNGSNSLVLDGDGNIVLEGTPSGNAINRGLVWDYGANANGVNSTVRQDNGGLTVRAWTENGGGANGYSAPVSIVTNQDAATKAWIFDGQGNLTVPTGSINSINDGGDLGAYITLTPDLGLTRLAARDAQTSVNYTNTSWSTATYTGTQVDFTNAPDLVSFFNENQFNVGVNQTFSINGGEPVPFTGYTIGVSNAVTVYTDVTPEPDPTTVTSIDFLYQLESYVAIDYDGSELNINATGLTILIDNDQTEGPDITLRSGDDITLQAKDMSLGSEREGGDINLNAGDGADDDGGGNTASTGGDIILDAGRGGDGNSSSGSSGGFTTIRGGAGGSAGLTSIAGPGGYVSIQGGDGGTDGGNTSLGGVGGNVSITAGLTRQEGVNGPNVVISSGQAGPNALAGYVDIFTPASANGLGGTWRFDGNGNLTLPNNTFAVNYANGTQVPLGSSGNTGNVTFDDNIVIGTGDEYGGDGLFLATGPDGVANLQYLRLRGGDQPTHIHLDTGNNEFYDQYFGDDGKFVKLEAGSFGNVSVGTQDLSNNNIWTFTTDANLILAGGNSVIQSIANSSLDPLNPNVSTMVLTPDPGYSTQALVLDPTAPGHIHLRAPGANIDEPGANIFLGGEDTSFEVTYGANNQAVIHSGGYDWTFGNDGALTVPFEGLIRSFDDTIVLQSVDTGTGNANSVRLATDGSLYFEGTEYLNGWFQIANDSDNANIVSPSGNISITPAFGVANAAGKSLNLQGGAADQSDFYTGTGGAVNITGGLGSSDDGGGGGPGGNVNITSGLSADPAGVAGNINITTSDNDWVFGNDGILTFPGTPRIDTDANNFEVQAAEAINFEANTVVNIYTDSGNNAYQWQFGDDGNLTLPDTTSVIANASITLEANSTGNITGLSVNGDADANLYAHGNVKIVSDSSNTTATWSFGLDGNLTLPANTFAINYANGTQVSLGGGSNIANGNSNVSIATANGNVTISAVGNTTMTVTGTGANVTGTLNVTGNITGNTNGFTIGYLNIPQVAAANATLALTDAGKHYYSTTAGNFTLTIPNNATTSFVTGTAISIVVQAAGNILVNADTGVTLYMAGNSSAANRVVGSYGMATLLKVATDTWFINGTGVS